MELLNRTIDEIDTKLIGLLQEDARIPNAELARQVGMAPSAVFERLKKLEERGIVNGYEARLNSRALGFGLAAFIFVRTAELGGAYDAAEELAKIPEVQEVHHVAGEDCLLVKVRTLDTETLGELLRTRFGSIPAIRATRTTIVLQTVKEVSTIPIPEVSRA